jgi:hypothetical protein
MAQWWNSTDCEKSKYWKQTCPSITWSTTNPTQIVLETNLGIRDERKAPNRLSLDTASRISKFHNKIQYERYSPFS